MKERPKFKVGDNLMPLECYKGIEDMTVTRIDDKYYYLKIPCGKVILPIAAQVNYKLKTDK